MGVFASANNFRTDVARLHHRQHLAVSQPDHALRRAIDHFVSPRSSGRSMQRRDLPRSDMHQTTVSPVQQHQDQCSGQRGHGEANGTFLRYINRALPCGTPILGPVA